MLGVVGDVVQDVVVWQLEPRREATDTRSEVVVSRGGSAANVAAFAATRHPTRFIGCVGDDPAGESLRIDLERHGVDVRLQRGSRTGIIVVVVDQAGERTMYPSRGASAELGPIDPTWLDGLAALHLTGYSFETAVTTAAVLEAAEAVRTAGGVVSLDVSSVGSIRHHGVPAFLDLVQRCGPHILTANRDECLVLGLADGERSGPNLARFTDTILLARAGAAGASVFTDGHHVARVPVTPVEGVRDMTGAGDAFNAGFLTSYLASGRDAVRSVVAGHSLAAQVLRSPGATLATEPPAQPGPSEAPSPR